MSDYLSPRASVADLFTSRSVIAVTAKDEVVAVTKADAQATDLRETEDVMVTKAEDKGVNAIQTKPIKQNRFNHLHTLIKL